MALGSGHCVAWVIQFAAAARMQTAREGDISHCVEGPGDDDRRRWGRFQDKKLKAIVPSADVGMTCS
jgi:hypothetical protein